MIKVKPMIRQDFYRIIFCCTLAVLLSACATTQPGSAGRSGTVIVGAKDAIAIDPRVNKDFKEALSLLKDEKYEQAIEILESVVKRENRVTAPYVNLGVAYMKVGKMDKAEQSLLQAVKLDPGHPIANNELGLLYRKTGRFSQARKIYEKTLDDYPDLLPVRKNLAILCDIYMNDLDCALKNFEKLAEYVPDDEKIKIWIAEIKARKGK